MAHKMDRPNEKYTKKVRKEYTNIQEKLCHRKKKEKMMMMMMMMMMIKHTGIYFKVK